MSAAKPEKGVSFTPGSMGPLGRKCTATSKRSGKRCQRWPVNGSNVCPMHGGRAPQVKASAAKRLTLAEAFERGDRRPAWQILADALHSADTLMLDARVKLADGEPVSLDALDRFIEALDRAQKFAKIVLDANVDERQTQAAEAMVVMLGGWVDRAMAAVGLPVAVQGQLRKAIAAEVRTSRANGRG